MLRHKINRRVAMLWLLLLGFVLMSGCWASYAILGFSSDWSGAWGVMLLLALAIPVTIAIGGMLLIDLAAARGAPRWFVYIGRGFYVLSVLANLGLFGLGFARSETYPDSTALMVVTYVFGMYLVTVALLLWMRFRWLPARLFRDAAFVVGGACALAFSLQSLGWMSSGGNAWTGLDPWEIPMALQAAAFLIYGVAIILHWIDCARAGLGAQV